MKGHQRGFEISKTALSASPESREILHEAVARYTRVIREAEKVCFIARAPELQSAAREQLSELGVYLADAKAGFVQARDETAANACLALECLVRALYAELSMYLAWKDDSAENAWDHLIEAQTASGAAIRAHPLGQAGLRRLGHYDQLENLLFPPQVFQSVGAVVRDQECSICGSDYDGCEHIKGRPYFGQLCHVRITLADLSHVALVEEPADKRCRVTHFSEGGKWRNRMTWRLEERGSEDAPWPSDTDPSARGLAIRGVAVRYS